MLRLTVEAFSGYQVQVVIAAGQVNDVRLYRDLVASGIQAIC